MRILIGVADFLFRQSIYVYICEAKYYFEIIMKDTKPKKCWEGWKKMGTHMGVTGHQANTCVPINSSGISKSKTTNKKK